MKKFLAAIGLAVVGAVLYFGVYNAIPPSAEISVVRDASGACRFHIDPNFVVRSVYRVSVADATGVIAERKQPVAGPQDFVIGATLAAGTTLTVHCDLQYNRTFSANLSTQTSSLVVP